jgi:hypothetical protein
MIVNNALESMWEEVVVSYLKVISRNLGEGTEENDENAQNIMCPS